MASLPSPIYTLRRLLGATLCTGATLLTPALAQAQARAGHAQEGLCKPVHEALDADGTHAYEPDMVSSRHVELAGRCVSVGDRLGLPSLVYTLIYTKQLGEARRELEQADRRNVDLAALKRMECLLLRHEAKPQQAIAPCEESLRLDPGLALSYVTLANAHEESGDMDKALQVARQGATEHPANYLVWSALYAKMVASKRYTAKDYLPVLQRRHAIYAQRPGDVVQLMQALRDVRPAQAQEAIDIASRLLAAGRQSLYADADYANVHRQRGLAYELLNNTSAALVDFDEAIRLDPRSAKHRVERGTTLAHMGRDKSEQALADLLKAVELDPKHAFAHRYLGHVYMAMGKMPEARAALNTSLALNDKDGETWALSGEHHLRQDNFQQASVDLQRAVDLVPGDARSWHNLGIAYHEVGQYRKALPYLSRALEHNPKQSASWFWRARTYSSLNMDKEAVADYTSLIEVNPGYLWAYRNRADLRMMRGDFAGAHADFTKTADTRPKELAMDWFMWALSGQEMGKPAAELLARLHRDAPITDASAQWAMVLLLLRQGKLEEAAAIHDAALDNLATYRYSGIAVDLVVRAVRRAAVSEEVDERYRNWAPPPFNCSTPALVSLRSQDDFDRYNRQIDALEACKTAWGKALAMGNVKAMMGADFHRVSPETLRSMEQKMERAWREAKARLASFHEESTRFEEAEAQHRKDVAAAQVRQRQEASDRRDRDRMVSTLAKGVQEMARTMATMQPMRSSPSWAPIYVRPGAR